MNVKIVGIALLCATLIHKSTEDCRVLSDCEDGMRWKTLNTEGISGRPGKRGAPGPRGQKGEPGLGVNIEELKVQLQEEEDEGPELFFYSNTLTWDTAKTFCQNIGKRICSSSQLCVQEGGGQRLIPDVFPGDHWVPVMDSHNEWLEAGTSLKRTCFLHGPHYGKPAWGTSRAISQPYKGYIYCCPKNQLSDPIAEGIRYQYIGKTATYASSRQHCESQGMRLCHASEVCRDDKPHFEVITGDMWVAVNDRFNEWVEIGDSAGRTCWVHGVKYQLPPWGIRKDGSTREHVGYVLCCPVT